MRNLNFTEMRKFGKCKRIFASKSFDRFNESVFSSTSKIFISAFTLARIELFSAADFYLLQLQDLNCIDIP